MSGAGCSAAQAEVIRWNDAGQGGDVQHAAFASSVQRYDAQGQLIIPARPAAQDESEAPEGERNDTAVDVSYSTRGVAAPADVLPAIRLIATRYQDHPALRSLDLSPAEWAAFFQAMIKVESNYTQGAVSHAGAKGLAQLMPGTADYLRVDAGDPRRAGVVRAGSGTRPTRPGPERGCEPEAEQA